MRWSGVRISGGSPKQTVSRRRLFCFTPQARDSNGVRAACRLRNASERQQLFAKSDTCTKQLLFTAFYRIYTLRVLHTLVNSQHLSCIIAKRHRVRQTRGIFFITAKTQQTVTNLRRIHGNNMQKVFYQHSPHPHKFRKEKAPLLRCILVRPQGFEPGTH